MATELTTDYGTMPGFKTPNYLDQVRTTRKILKIKKTTAKMAKKNVTFIDVFNEKVKQFPNKTLLMFGDKTWTFKEVDAMTNRYAHAIHALDIVKPNDVVALVAENSPEYLFFWMGIAKLGGATALVNSSVKGKALYDSIVVSKADCVFIGTEFAERLSDVIGGGRKSRKSTGGIEVPPELLTKKWYSMNGPVSGLEDIGALAAKASDETFDPSINAARGIMDALLFIYTSGTTGLPKAAKIKNSRVSFAGVGIQTMLNYTPNDIVYCALPLCHSSATFIGWSAAVHSGAALALRTKFSATNYFPDCKKYGATVGMYIGELCRFLTLKDASEGDTDHKLRAVVGNGMRPDVWVKFVERFKIPKVFEFYGSTEGNVTMINTQNKVGAIGYTPPLLKLVYPMKIVKFDQDTQEPWRNEKGRCVECKANEPGEAMSEIRSKDPLLKFDGYTNQAATDKKILRDVFKPGDAYFRTGDLLRKDKYGFVFWVDRVGDTFRWRGENVATTEVAHVLDGADVLEMAANVYGAAIPNHDGRCGMAAITPKKSVKIQDVLSKLLEAQNQNLAAFQRAYFLRIVPEIDMTGTVKLKKNDLVAAGADPEKCDGDSIYFLKGDQYVPLTKELYQSVTNPGSKLL